MHKPRRARFDTLGVVGYIIESAHTRFWNSGEVFGERHPGEVDTADGDDGFIVEVCGVVDSGSAPQLRDRLPERVRSGSGKVVVDLDGGERPGS